IAASVSHVHLGVNPPSRPKLVFQTPSRNISPATPSGSATPNNLIFGNVWECIKTQYGFDTLPAFERPKPICCLARFHCILLAKDLLE
ncbi:MAG: hypothetical protein FWB75_06915, partial [Oscillospiraceae bacterium]|nr:hypothetical protein [Oscillospiraceae bacterium]